MSTNEDQSKKTMKIVLGIAIPVLIALAMIVYIIMYGNELYTTPQVKSYVKLLDQQNNQIEPTGLFGNGVSLETEISNVIRIFESVNLNCYNVDWYSFTGQQIFPVGTVEQIDMHLDKGINRITFYNNVIVAKYLELNCPHISVKQANDLGERYDPSIGVSAFTACTNAKYDQAYCDQLKDPNL